MLWTSRNSLSGLEELCRLLLMTFMDTSVPLRLPNQPHFSKATLANGLEEPVVFSVGLLVAGMAARSCSSVTYC